MAGHKDVLDLNLDKSDTFKLHPVVVFSILDHFKRRNKGQKRVVGTLLGTRKGNEVYISNCFPVQHIEGEDEVCVDMDYHQRMFDLHTKVSKEVVVGWYCTGSKITYISSLIHDVFKGIVEQPVHLTVDTGLKNDTMGVKAYLGNTINVGGRGVVVRFENAPLSLHAYEAEKIGVDSLINGVPDDSKLDAPATILTDFENLAPAFLRLLELLQTAQKYVDEVVEKKKEGDVMIGRSISDALAAIPHVNKDSFDDMFNSSVQDLLMTLNLKNLTKAQAALADKISHVLTN